MPGFGRPEKPIDWEIVDRLLLSGCVGCEIAPRFNMKPETFYDRVYKHYGVSFTEYSAALHSQGKSYIKQKQFSEAMNGNTKMLIHLGECVLKQRKPMGESEVSEDMQKQEESFHRYVSSLRKEFSSAKKSDLSTNNSE